MRGAFFVVSLRNQGECHETNQTVHVQLHRRSLPCRAEPPHSDTKVLPATVCQAVAGSTPRGDYQFGSYGLQPYDLSRWPPDHLPHRARCNGQLPHGGPRSLQSYELGSDTITRKVYSQSDDGSARDSTDPAIATSSNVGSHELVFTIDALDHFNGGTFAVQCTLNQGLSVSGIKYTED